MIYPDLRHERIPVGYRNLVSLPEIHRVDLNALSGQDRVTPGWELLRLIIDETGPAIEHAQRLLRAPPAVTDRLELCNFIETILVYKLPRSTREEIQTMLGITDIDLKQTRFYQDVLAEGRQEGRLEGKREGKLEGKREGRRTEAAEVLKRLAQLRFGELPADIQENIEAAELEQLEQWLERLLTAPHLEAIFSDSGQ